MGDACSAFHLGFAIACNSGRAPRYPGVCATARELAVLSGKCRHSEKGEAVFQVAYGEGIARYVEDLRGLGLDAGLDGSNNLEALPTIASYVGYRRFWTESLRSTFLFSSTSVDNSAGQAADVFHASSYIAANLIWSVGDGLDLGVELLGGTRENNDGEDASVERLQFSATMTF